MSAGPVFNFIVLSYRFQLLQGTGLRPLGGGVCRLEATLLVVVFREIWPLLGFGGYRVCGLGFQERVAGLCKVLGRFGELVVEKARDLSYNAQILDWF